MTLLKMKAGYLICNSPHEAGSVETSSTAIPYLKLTMTSLIPPIYHSIVRVFELDTLWPQSKSLGKANVSLNFFPTQ